LNCFNLDFKPGCYHSPRFPPAERANGRPRITNKAIMGVSKMRTTLARFLKDESGSTAIEYGLIAAGIAIAILTAVNALGGSLNGLFGG